MLQTNDATDWNELFKLYYRPLCLFALHFVDDADDCEDIVQECFVKMWRRKSEGHVVSDAKRYLFASVKNACLTASGKGCAVVPIDGNESAEIAASDDEIDRSQREARLWTAIDSLPERCREVLLMCKRDGMSQADVASQLGISVKTVENQMSKAYRVLRGKAAEIWQMAVGWLF